MGNISVKININGWVNLDDALIAASATYQPGRAKAVIITNLSATAVTVHATDSGTQPSTAANGTPLGAGASTTAIGNNITLENVDLAGIWINTPSALDILFLVIGL